MPRFANVWLRLDIESEPLAGSISADDGPSRAFIGRLGLFAAIERELEHARSEKGPAANRLRPGSELSREEPGPAP